MKSSVLSIAAASMLATAATAYSQTDSTLTRAQVRAELQQLEQAGYAPARGEDATYPADIQAAETQLSNEKETTAYGGATSESSGTGSTAIAQPASDQEMRRLFSRSK